MEAADEFLRNMICGDKIAVKVWEGAVGGGDLIRLGFDC